MPSQVLGRRVAMLEPLDPQRLDALLRDVGDDADCLNIRAAKEYFAMNDMAEGLLALIDSFGFKPRLYHEEGNFAKWKILFRDSPFRSLRLQPSPDGVVDIYAFRTHVVSSQILNNPQNWQPILHWLWGYGKQRQIKRLKDEASRRNTRSRTATKNAFSRPEKPLLRQVLRIAGFKSPHGAASKARGKDMEFFPEAADITMEDSDAGSSLHRSALHTIDPNRQAIMKLGTKVDRIDEGVAAIDADDVDIAGLDVRDGQS